MIERDTRCLTWRKSRARWKEKRPRSQEIETRSFREENVKHDRTEKPVVCRNTSHAQGASQTRSFHDSKKLQRWCWNKSSWNGETRCLPWCKSRAINVKRRLTSTSEYPDCHILSWNKLRTIVFVNSLRSRTTLTDNLFNEIYNNKAYNPSSAKSKKMIQDMGT